MQKKATAVRKSRHVEYINLDPETASLLKCRAKKLGVNFQTAFEITAVSALTMEIAREIPGATAEQLINIRRGIDMLCGIAIKAGGKLASA